MMRSKRNRRRSSRRSWKFSIAMKLGVGFVGVFLIAFFYLYQSQKVREMLIEEQSLREEEERLTEENRQLELDIANFCSLENLQNSITGSDFGFPPPERMIHLHWLSDEEKTPPDWMERTSDLVFDWLKEALDVKAPTHADSLE